MKNKKHHFKNNISGQISLPKFSTTPPKKWVFLRPKGLRFHWRRCCWLRSTGSNDSLWYRSASTLAPPLSPRMPRIFFRTQLFFGCEKKKTPQKPRSNCAFFVGGLGSSNDFDPFWVIFMFRSWGLSLDVLFLSGTWELFSLSTLPLLGPTLAFFWKRRMMKTSGGSFNRSNS